jgi:hypothetical protein
MEHRLWRVEVEGKQYVVEYKIKFRGDGDVLVDGAVVASWQGFLGGPPREQPFTIGGKPAILQRRGMINQHFDLVFEGKVYSEKEGRQPKQASQ